MLLENELLSHQVKTGSKYLTKELKPWMSIQKWSKIILYLNQEKEVSLKRSHIWANEDKIFDHTRTASFLNLQPQFLIVKIWTSFSLNLSPF